MRHAKVNGVEVAYEVVGRGVPILFIHGAHIADAMRPLADDPALDRFQRIRYHRRGVGGSGCPPEARATAVAVHADDAVRLLEHLGVERAHVVGHSSGGSIALEIASRHPTRVSSLVLLEPGLMMVPSGAAFVDLVRPLVGLYEGGDADSAVHGFLALVGDRDWRSAIERTVPGGIAQAVTDAATFFASELPAVSDWTFGPEQAAAITCPVLSVLGSETSPLFVEGNELLHEWFPQCHDADIPGASHLLQMEAPEPVAAAIATFLFRRSPSTTAAVAAARGE